MISEREWVSVRAMVESVIKSVMGTRMDYFVTGQVIDRDEKNKLVWLAEFGDQPVPVVAYNYNAFYYDESPRLTKYGTVGTNADYKTYKKKLLIEIEVPKVGETVLVAREWGTRRLPRCLGVLQGQNWIIVEAE